MGTRAQFFVGNPQDLASRVWLGCIAFDGYPDGDCSALAACSSEAEFREAIAKLAAERKDFCDPAMHGFPFPWTDDLFLTDCTYAWFDGAVRFTRFHQGWIGLAEYLTSDEVQDAYSEREEALPEDVPAPTATWDRSGPDSIIIVSAGPGGLTVS